MKRSIKYPLLAIVVLLAAAGYYAYTEYNRVNPDLASSDADMTITASELSRIYTENEEAGNKQYLNKVLRVKGMLRSVEKDNSGDITLMLEGTDPLSGIACQLDARHHADTAKAKMDSSITVQGVCTGLLTDVVLVRCVVLQ